MRSSVRAATAKRFTVRLNNMVLANKMRSEQASGVRRRSRAGCGCGGRRSEVGHVATCRFLFPSRLVIPFSQWQNRASLSADDDLTTRLDSSMKD